MYYVVSLPADRQTDKTDRQIRQTDRQTDACYDDNTSPDPRSERYKETTREFLYKVLNGIGSKTHEKSLRF